MFGAPMEEQMSVSEIAVTLSGVALIAWVNWYFFKAGRKATSAEARKGASEVTITVRGGYSPSTIQSAAGQPLRLIFDRQETSGCSEEVVFPDFEIRRFLPPHEKTTIELPAREPGTYEFTCGMSMLRGRVIIQ
jgi:plastocyanin domain-containing protein